MSCDWSEALEQFDLPDLQPHNFPSHPHINHSLPIPVPHILSTFAVMASRRLAFSLNQALRSRAALKAIQPVKRGFASPVALPSSTQSTTLSNGLTVRKNV